MNYKIKITEDRYDGFLKAELLCKQSFLWITFWGTLCVYREAPYDVNLMVVNWAQHFKIPKENIIYLN